jgi:hypothetical protein
MIKLRKKGWVRHAAGLRMDQVRDEYKILVQEPERSRKL